MKIRKWLRLLPLLLSLAGVLQIKAQKTILLSKTYGKGEYEAWLHRIDSRLRLVSLYHVRSDSVEFWLNHCDGILMTGGEDVYPAWYGREQDTVDCGSFDLHRDSLELKMLDYAFARKKPLFGICRGLQIINIHQKGTLVPDIPSRMGEKVKHRQSGPVEHEVKILPNSRLFEISAIRKGRVLSNHHQGIDRPGKNLHLSARSADCLPEAIEGSDTSPMPFLMAVQWHPEKMDPESPLSKPLATQFVQAVLSGVK
jgi:putative glutamine amidotransferase